jgi:3-methyladenine DNA glycosylase/8-oxoguanine DNA glycosylase
VVDSLDAALFDRARRTLTRRDPVLAPVIRRIGPCGLNVRGDPYRFLVRSIVHQQIAGAAARAIEGRLRASFGGRIPSAARLRRASAARLRGVGLSRQKIASVRAIARAFDDGALGARRLRTLDDDGVIALVTQIRGVGEWTAHMLLMHALGRPDVLPVGDYGIRKGVQALYGLLELPRRAELEAIAAAWRPYRSVASWYLWRSLDAAPPG